jgi:hypothetical protein
LRLFPSSRAASGLFHEGISSSRESADKRLNNQWDEPPSK